MLCKPNNYWTIIASSTQDNANKVRSEYNLEYLNLNSPQTTYNPERRRGGATWQTEHHQRATRVQMNHTESGREPADRLARDRWE